MPVLDEASDLCCRRRGGNVLPVCVFLGPCWLSRVPLLLGTVVQACCNELKILQLPQSVVPVGTGKWERRPVEV